MKSLKLLIFILLLVLVNSCTEETVIFFPDPGPELESNSLLFLDSKACMVDKTNGIMKFSIGKDLINDFSPYVEFNPESEIWFDSKQLLNNKVNAMGSLEYGIAYPIKIVTKGITKEFDLYFTSFPIAHVVHIEDIVDEPKSCARIYINDTYSDQIIDSYIGIEIRGNYTQRYPKKSFGFSLYKERDRTTYSGKILGMRASTKWILDAVYNDPSKMRNWVCTEIWQDLFAEHSFITNNEFQYVELFDNQVYKGIYVLSQKQGPEFLNISNSNTVLYKADAVYGGQNCHLSTIYTQQPDDNLFWDGWTQVHPENYADWDLFALLLETLINGSDEEFTEEIAKIIDLPAFIDYYLFMNVCAAWDNTGDNKNLFLIGQHDNTQLSVIPWDMDFTFGVGWNETVTSTSAILSNNLYDRLEELNPNDYRRQVKERWFELRSTTLTVSKLIERFKVKFEELDKNKVQFFDNDCWELDQDYTREFEFIQSWTEERIVNLDMYFESYCVE